VSEHDVVHDFELTLLDVNVLLEHLYEHAVFVEVTSDLAGFTMPTRPKDSVQLHFAMNLNQAM
jgi:hypothetical protein